MFARDTDPPGNTKKLFGCLLDLLGSQAQGQINYWISTGKYFFSSYDRLEEATELFLSCCRTKYRNLLSSKLLGATFCMVLIVTSAARVPHLVLSRAKT